MKKRNRLLILLMAAIMALALPAGALAAPKQGWSQDNTRQWSYYNSKWYTGWHKIGSEWYLFSNEGYMLTGWRQSGGVWYHFNTSGAMSTGWLKSGAAWYYFNQSGAMVTGWKQIGNAWYYFASSGAMASNQWIDNCYLDSNGAWDTSKSQSSNSGNDDQVTGEIWLAASGDKYHDINNCGNMNPNNARKVTLEEAKRLGYQPCAVCNPPK